VEIDTSLSATNFDLAAGAITGTGSLAISNELDWEGGFINGPTGAVTVLGTGVTHITGGAHSVGGTLSLAGATDWTGGGYGYIQGAGTINNLAGGTFTIVNDKSFNGRFNNSGVLRKTYDPITGDGLGTSEFRDLYNPGTIDVESGTLFFDGSVSQVTSGTLTGGTWKVVGSAAVPATLTFNGQTINTIGLFASVTLDGPGAMFSQLSGLSANAGSLSLLDGQSFTTPGGFTNSKALTIGAGSTLNVAGSFAQTSTGALNVTIAGSPASGQFGRIVATGTATLAGALNVTVPGSFSPNVGDRYRVISDAGQTGSFGKTVGLILPGGKMFRADYNPTNFTLTTVAAAKPVDVTHQVSIVYGGFRVNHATGMVSQTVIITNSGTAPIVGPMSLVLDGLTNATLVNANGTTVATSPVGSPYISVGLGVTGTLARGQSATVVLQFYDPSFLAITYTSRVLAGPGIR
jgi:hypothetical protein